MGRGKGRVERKEEPWQDLAFPHWEPRDVPRGVGRLCPPGWLSLGLQLPSQGRPGWPAPSASVLPLLPVPHPLNFSPCLGPSPRQPWIWASLQVPSSSLPLLELCGLSESLSIPLTTGPPSFRCHFSSCVSLAFVIFALPRALAPSPLLSLAVNNSCSHLGITSQGLPCGGGSAVVRPTSSSPELPFCGSRTVDLLSLVDVSDTYYLNFFLNNFSPA